MLLNKDKIYYHYYYMIRYILYGNEFEGCLKRIKEDFCFEQYQVFLCYLNKVILNDDYHSMICDETKLMIQDILLEILKIYKGSNLYTYINDIVNKVKINLNLLEPNIYDKENYLAQELSYKLNKCIYENDQFINWEQIEYSIKCDFQFYDDMIFEQIELSDEQFNAFYIWSINTYLTDIKELKDDDDFISNVNKIVKHNLELGYIKGFNNKIPLSTVRNLRKDSKKILKRIK